MRVRTWVSTDGRILHDSHGGERPNSTRLIHKAIPGTRAVFTEVPGVAIVAPRVGGGDPGVEGLGRRHHRLGRSCPDRLSRTTTSPGRNVGTNAVMPKVSMASRPSAPSSCSDGPDPVAVNVATSVTASQRPRGTRPTNRSSRRLRPRSGSRWSACSSRRGRSAGPERQATWAVASCSRAIRDLFFKRQPLRHGRHTNDHPLVACQRAQCLASVASGYACTRAASGGSSAMPMRRRRPGRRRARWVPVCVRWRRQQRIVDGSTRYISATSTTR